MKRFTLLVLYGIVGINPAAHAGANVWTGIGPDGGLVQAIAVDPQNPATLYAVAGGAIFMTTDGAANCTRVYSPATSDGTTSNPAIALAINPRGSNRIRRRCQRTLQEHRWRSELELDERRGCQSSLQSRIFMWAQRASRF